LLLLDEPCSGIVACAVGAGLAVAALQIVKIGLALVRKQTNTSLAREVVPPLGVRLRWQLTSIEREGQVS